MKKLNVVLLLALALVFILGCTLFSDAPSNEPPAAPAQPVNEEPPQQSAPVVEEPAPSPIPEPTTPPVPQSLPGRQMKGDGLEWQFNCSLQ